MEKEQSFSEKEPGRINKIGSEIRKMPEEELKIFTDYEESLGKAYQKEGGLEQNIKQAQEMLRSKFGDEWKLYLSLWRIQEGNKRLQRVFEVIQNIKSLSEEDRQLFERYHEEVGDVFAEEDKIPKDMLKNLLERFGSDGWRAIYDLYKEKGYHQEEK